MAINFPSSPNNGDSVIINGVLYSYDLSKTVWKTTEASGATVPLSISNTSNTANVAFNVANLAVQTANVSFNQANTSTTIATSAFASSNTKVATVAGVSTTDVSNNILLSGILAVDGVGSGLDADVLDGLAGGGSGFYALKANNLSVFASTTSAQLAGIISDETGSGSLVFATSPTLAGTPQAPTAAIGTANTMIATTAFASNASALASGIVNPSRIVGSYTSITGVGTITAGTWQGSSISTTYTNAKLTSVAATSPIATSGATGAITLSHVNSGVAAATYGNASIIPVITVNATGHVTSVSNVAIESSGITTGKAIAMALVFG